jgi:GTPase
MILIRGTIREGDRVCYGPNEEGEFQSTRITSIQRYGTPCRLVKAGQAATLALSGVQRASIRKGMMILDHKFKRHGDADVCWRFMANIYVLRHFGSTGIRKGFQSTVNVASIMQSTIIDSIEEVERERCVCIVTSWL